MRRLSGFLILLIVIFLLISKIIGDDAVNSVLIGDFQDVVLGLDGLDIAIVVLLTIFSIIVLYPNRD